MKKRQIVVIMTDTQRKDMLGCYGNPKMKTPNLDNLASRGLRFENAYTTQPVCGPARSALFTGTFPHTNGSWGNSMPLSQQTKTIGQRLSNEGFNTAYIGKYHLDGGDYFGWGECPDGWNPEYWYDHRSYLEELSEKDRKKSRAFKTLLDPSFTEEKTFGYRVAGKAEQFLLENNEDDFFMVASFDEPHDPYLCPMKYVMKHTPSHYRIPENYKEDLSEKPEQHRLWSEGESLSPAMLKIMTSIYFGCNSFVDAQIGRVLEAVDKYAPDALIIYTSDHGDSLGSHGFISKGPSMYEETTNIPFIVRWPGESPENESSESLVSHIDLVPTVLDYAGFTAPKTLEGKSLLALFRDKDATVNNEVFMEYGRYEVDLDGFGGFQPIRCVFDGRYKLVINLLETDELYDLSEDPTEEINLIENKLLKETRNRLHDRLLGWMNESRDPFRGYHWECRPWRDDARKPSYMYTAMTRQKFPEPGEKTQLDYATGMEILEYIRKKH
jgi:uncharacterized sulfatase